MNGHWNPARALLVWSIRGYQTLISPALPRSCKYHPSCSHYAVDALTEYGALRGFVLASWRLLRCNPLGYGGYDPVENQTLFESRTKRDRSSGHRGVGPSQGCIAPASVDVSAKLRSGRGAKVSTGRSA
ncbi:MAG: membrane protein insertion efficiency factor YidD [bacterium]